MKRIALTLMILWAALILPVAPAGADDTALQHLPFEQIVEKARGTEVRWYMYGGWAHVNDWVDTHVAAEMKKRYDIRLVRVPMDAGVFVNKLLNEKAAGKQKGNIDLLWINGENFKNAKEAGLLFGPFADTLPNVKKYVDPASVTHDFGYPVEGYEAPYGRAQFVFEYDSAQVTPPADLAGLKAWIMANPGRFTYPQPPDFTGSAFIRQVFYAVTGGHDQYMAGWDADLFAKKAPLLWKWLNEVEPYLWQKGRTYPKDSATLDTLFSRGEVAFGMSYHPSHAQSKIIEGSYPATARTFVLKDGAIFNTHFTAIPFNAPNKAGGMVLANLLISADIQLSKYRPDQWGDFPALDISRLPEADQKRFQDVDLGPATLGSEILGPVAVPEIPSAYLEALEQGWKEHVLDK
ncbi:MAG TPA: ABC transporter substrate-binding protein [Desulfobacteraceae bacterium]|nr:ABC transporter substrate-binding protein [Desulfobacteraceae bacterium]